MLRTWLDIFFHPDVGLILTIILAGCLVCIAILALIFAVTIDLNKLAVFIFITSTGWTISGEIMPRVNGRLKRGLVTVCAPITLGLAGTTSDPFAESALQLVGGPFNFICGMILLLTINAVLILFRQRQEDAKSISNLRQIPANTLVLQRRV